MLNADVNKKKKTKKVALQQEVIYWKKYPNKL